MQKVRWMDDHWARFDGGRGTAELVDGSVYLAISIRNVGSGLAVPFGWAAIQGVGDHPGPTRRAGGFPAPNARPLRGPVRFRVLAGRHPKRRPARRPDYHWLSRTIASHDAFTIELLYGDHDGGQRTISRFGMIPWTRGEEVHWYPSAARHWYLDRPDPR